MDQLNEFIDVFENPKKIVQLKEALMLNGELETIMFPKVLC